MEMLKDWLPIVISSIALISSIYFSYVSTLRKKPNLKYFESWDIHQLPQIGMALTPGTSGGSTVQSFLDELKTKLILGFAPYHQYLYYVIDLSNTGDRETDPIHIKFSNLPGLTISYRFMSALDWDKPQLSWEPRTYKPPSFQNETLQFEKLPATGHARLTVMVPLPKNKRYIQLGDVPYIEDVKSGKIHASRTNELPFEDGSVKRLQERLQKELSSSIEQSEEIEKRSKRKKITKKNS